jgi:type II pantothenate kinase
LALVIASSCQVDMLVGDIYGGRDYSNIGLSASTIASSFGKVVGQDKELTDYNPAGEITVCSS